MRYLKLPFWTPLRVLRMNPYSGIHVKFILWCQFRTLLTSLLVKDICWQYFLLGGRVNICEIAATYGVKAITIAVRYSASRKQFGPENSDVEYPVIEYQAQQYRLLPHVANAFAVQFFATFIGKVYGDMTLQMLQGEDTANAGAELHALSSAAKPVCTWTVRDIIQECREACGGHGYLKCSRLGMIKWSLRKFSKLFQILIWMNLQVISEMKTMPTVPTKEKTTF